MLVEKDEIAFIVKERYEKPSKNGLTIFFLGGKIHHFSEIGARFYKLTAVAFGGKRFSFCSVTKYTL